MPDTKAPPSPLIRKLDELAARFDSLRESLNDAATVSNPQKLISISRESGQLEPLVTRYRDYQKTAKEIEGLREMIESKADPDMAELAQEELPEAQKRAQELLESIKDELVAAEDNAVDSFFLEI